MSKYLKTLIAILSVILIFQTQTIETYASDNISVVVDGEKVVFNGQQPIVKNGRTLVPFRPIFETIGMSVSFDANSQAITAKDSKCTVVMKLNDKNFNVTYTEQDINGGYLSVNYTFDVPPQVIKGTTYVPIGFLFDSIDYSVNYDSSTKTVYLISEEKLVETILLIESVIVNDVSDAVENLTTNPDYSIEILTQVKELCLTLKNDIFLGTLTETLTPLITNFADNMLLGSDELISTATYLKENNIEMAQTHSDTAHKYFDNAKPYSIQLVSFASKYNITSDSKENNLSYADKRNIMYKALSDISDIYTNVNTSMRYGAINTTTSIQYSIQLLSSAREMCLDLKSIDYTPISTECNTVVNNFADNMINAIDNLSLSMSYLGKKDGLNAGVYFETATTYLNEAEINVLDFNNIAAGYAEE